MKWDLFNIFVYLKLKLNWREVGGGGRRRWESKESLIYFMDNFDGEMCKMNRKVNLVSMSYELLLFVYWGLWLG